MPLSLKLECLREKLKSSWKHIFRYLSSSDLSNQGLVSQQNFNHALQFTNTFLSTEEVNSLVKQFGDGKKNIDYMKVSKELIGIDSAVKS